ncbi:MAG: bifunctional nuclease family protein [Kiritimatiellaeota bacterium]|nr:bifunctional nuclease family protein [Kiritimatiellota bacterium]
MSDEIPVSIRNLLPGPGNWGVFLGTEGQDKVIAIFVDPTMAAAMLMALRKMQAPRPLTHELIARIFTGLGVRALKVVISDLNEGTYFARLYLEQQNDLGRNVVEIDARPSDSIAIAIQQQCPLYVARHVWDEADDMSDLLRQAEQRAHEQQEKDEDEGTPDTPGSQH